MSSMHDLMAKLLGEDKAAVMSCVSRIGAAVDAIRPLANLERWEDVKAMGELIAQNAETLAKSKQAGVIE